MLLSSLLYYSFNKIIGPFLYALYVAPLQDLTECILFADDNFPMETSNDINQLVTNLKVKLELMMKWRSQSGLKVNDDKTELCIFLKDDKIGMNLLVNRFSALNNTIELSWMNLSLNYFKIQYKSLFLS